MADSEAKEAVAAAPSDTPPPPSSSETSGSVSRFDSLLDSVQKNIETLNYVTKEVEKINDRILFSSSSITATEESTLINKVSKLHKDTSMKARDSSRMLQNMRTESTKPIPAPGSEGKKQGEKNAEELAAERRDLR